MSPTLADELESIPPDSVQRVYSFRAFGLPPATFSRRPIVFVFTPRAKAPTKTITHRPARFPSGCRTASRWVQRMVRREQGIIKYDDDMTPKAQVVEWARAQSDELQSDMRFEPSDGMYGGYWTVTDWRKKGLLMARAAAGLEFLRQHAGEDSEWLRRGMIAYESNADRSSMESGVHALGEILRLWADHVERGVTRLPAELGEGVRVLASTDLMDQVRLLNQDRRVHFAAPIVLAGAALETALRGAVDQLSLPLDPGSPGIALYGRALRTAGILGKQDMKDIEQMAGLRNDAAHGEFNGLSSERAGLMEQQVNVFLSRLRDLLDPSDRVMGGPKGVSPASATPGDSTP